MKSPTTTLVLVLFVCASAFGWNIPGHEAIGAISYLHLKANDPATVAKVVALLKTHPEYTTRWKAGYDAKTGDDQEMYLFMKAAGWPDVIKGNNPNHYPLNKTWHYINFPVATEAAAVAQPEATHNILTAIDNYVAVLKSSAPDASKAMALCWIFHLLGDLHQPLHNVSLFGDAIAKDGDHGGGEFYIKTKAGIKSTTTLHSYWDGILTRSKDFQKIKAVAIKIKANQSVSFDSNINLAYRTWSRSSVRLAETDVYRFNGMALKHGTEHDGQVLPPCYTAHAKEIGERQAAMAGMRLAVVLKKTVN